MTARFLARTAFLGVFVVVAGACLSGCASWVLGPSVPIDTVAITTVDKANRNAPIALDLVMISDDQLTASLLTMTAADWFQKRDQFLRDNPTTVAIKSWEPVPGQVLPAQDIDRPFRVKAAFLFANYSFPGTNRIRLVDEDNIRVMLGERAMSLVKS